MKGKAANSFMYSTPIPNYKPGMQAEAACNYRQPLIRQQEERFILFGHVSFSNLPKWILEVVCTAEHTESFKSLAEYVEMMCDLKSHIVARRWVLEGIEANRSNFEHFIPCEYMLCALFFPAFHR